MAKAEITESKVLAVVKAYDGPRCDQIAMLLTGENTREAKRAVGAVLRKLRANAQISSEGNTRGVRYYA